MLLGEKETYGVVDFDFLLWDDIFIENGFLDIVFVESDFLVALFLLTVRFWLYNFLGI